MCTNEFKSQHTCFFARVGPPVRIFFSSSLYFSKTFWSMSTKLLAARIGRGFGQRGATFSLDNGRGEGGGGGANIFVRHVRISFVYMLFVGCNVHNIM